MEKIKLYVCMDDNGHFHANKIKDRREIWELLVNDISDGDWFINQSSHPKDFEYDDLTDHQWNTFLNAFIQRGRAEYVDVII